MPFDPEDQVVLEQTEQIGAPSLHMLPVDKARGVNLSTLVAAPEEVGKTDISSCSSQGQ